MIELQRESASPRSYALTTLVLSLGLGILACSAILAQNSSSDETLTNADVVKMVRAHLSPDIVVQQIRGNSGNYSLGTNDLIKLKQLGVPDRVIAAMQAKKSGSASHSGEGATATAPVSQRTINDVNRRGSWRVEIHEDPMSGKKNWDARETFPIEYNSRRGEAQITASCDARSVSFQAGHFLSFDIVYESQFEKNLGFKQNQPDPTVVTGPATVYQGTIFGPGAVGPSKSEVHYGTPYVHFDARIDDYRMSSASSSQRPNELELRFSASELERAYGAQFIRAELPLSNGDRPIVEITPQDSSFREFAAKCPGSGVYSATYTADQLATALPGILHKAAVGHGLDSHAYDKEIDYIVSAVKTCATITPAMAAMSPSPDIPKYTKVDQRKGDINVAMKYGDQYSICQPNFNGARRTYIGEFTDVSFASGNSHVSPGESVHAANSDVFMSLGQSGDHLWREGKGFDLSLRLLAHRPERGGSSEWDFDDLLPNVHIQASSDSQAAQALPAAAPADSNSCGSPGERMIAISGGVAQGLFLSGRQPDHPQEAGTAGIVGRVVMQIVIGTDGHVLQVAGRLVTVTCADQRCGRRHFSVGL